MTGARLASEPATHRVAFANGLTLLVRENRAAPVVAITLITRVGSRDEVPVQNGITALLGRVLLKGARGRSALQLARIAEDAGGEIESGTDQEYSEVRTRGLAAHWRSLLGLVDDVVSAPELPEPELERERSVLLAQIRGREDHPFQVANRLLNRTLYGPEGYGLPTGGEPESVGGLAREDLVRHFVTFYRPERMVLAVSGDVTAGEVAEETARLLGAGPARAGTCPTPSPPPRQPVGRRDRDVRPTQQAQILMGVLAPPAGHPDHVPLQVANAVLGGGMSSRLFRILRDEKGLAYSVGSLCPMRRESGRVVVHIGTAPSNVATAEAGIRHELDRLAAERVSDEELELAKTQLAGGFVLDLRTNARRSFYLAFFEALGVGHAHVSDYPRRIAAVTAADVQRVAERYLVEPAIVVVGPA